MTLLPWEKEPDYFDRIAEAEAVITAAGYTRDTTRHLWVNGHRTAKVMRNEENSKFYVKWA